ncbi:hypothetical protein AGLY_016826, partial [Aphis glycines]
SLDKLTNNLEKHQFKELGKYFPEKHLDLLILTIIIDCPQKFDEICLPPIEKLYSSLIDKNITIEEYENSQKNWEVFNIQNLRELFTGLYNIIDVLLLTDIMENFRDISLKTSSVVLLTNEKFLIYDSLDDNFISEGRVVVFSTRRNLELLAKSDCWFLDETFKVCPNIFTQFFTILGTCKQHVDVHDTVAVPFVYALLSSKETMQYATVLRAVQSSFNEHRIFCEPVKIMTDFEKSIINACEEVFPNSPISC